MDMYQKREMRKNKKMNEDAKSLPSTGINWYPGHMAKTKRLIKENYNLIDIVYEVIDARIPYSSKIKDIDELLKDKPKILVVTKIDLCDNMETDKFLHDYEQQGYVVIPVDLLNNKNINEILVKTKEILNFYNVGKNILLNNNFDDNNFINIQKTYLSGYDLTIYQNGYDMYTFQYYENSLKEIVKAMKENLELQETELIKTFSFSINKEFTIPVIGKNVTSGTRNETLPNFIGSSIEYVKEWASSRNITITEEEYTSNDCENNKITNQDIRSGTLTNNIDNLKVTVCKNIAETEE